jgi:hypothetical protein
MWFEDCNVCVSPAVLHTLIAKLVLVLYVPTCNSIDLEVPMVN